MSIYSIANKTYIKIMDKNVDSWILMWYNQLSLLNIHDSNKKMTKSWACNHECKNPQCSIIKQEPKRERSKKNPWHLVLQINSTYVH